MSLVAIARALDAELASFSAPSFVANTYRPLRYAARPAATYLRRYGDGGAGGRTLLVGMNPGPFGMAQTGVPFGDVQQVRSFLGIEEAVIRPEAMHPRRPVEGFACRRSEVSGTRLWGWAQAQFGSAEAFFRHYFVYNWCPLVFMEASGKNVTPDQLPAAVARPLTDACDRALAATVRSLGCARVVGIGAFAAKRCRQALSAAGLDVPVDTVLHPSPASPAANRGWAAQATATLAALGLPTGAAPCLSRPGPRAARPRAPRRLAESGETGRHTGERRRR